MEMRKWVYLSMLATALAFVACDEDEDDPNNNTNDNTLSAVDSTFMVKAAMSNVTEVDFGELAASKGTDSLVRAFGQMMVQEHTTAQQELEQLANEHKITLPDTLDQQHQQIRQQLMMMSGWQFDSLYITTQVIDHTATLQIFETERNSGDEDDVKAYANKYAPHIQHHLELADSIHMVIVDGNDATDEEVDHADHDNGGIGRQ